MSSLVNKAYDFLVKVKYESNGDNSEGSAVIIPIDGVDYAYILTAKHTFGIDESQRRDDTYHTIDITKIKREDTELSHPENKFKILEVLNLTYDKYIDLIIFKIEKDEYIDKLSSLNIYEEKFTKALVYGYPTMREDDPVLYHAIDGVYRPLLDLKNKFELHLKDFPNIDVNQDTQNYVAGLSGAGVFVEDVKKEQIYLSGIVINSSMGNSIKCIDILALSKIINDKLEEKNLKPIGISGAKWKNEFGFDMSGLDFSEVIMDLSNKNKKNKFIQELNQYHNNSTKFIEIFEKSVKIDLTDEEKKLSEISDIYLYLGMNFHEFKENQRATHYFNKAIKYGGVQNKTYLFDAKSKRSKNNNKIKENNDTENEFIEAMVNALYENIYELEEQLNIDKENSNIKKLLMESYRDIILKLGLLADNDERIQKCRNRLLELYDNFKEYDYIKEEISELKSRIDLNEQFEGMKNQVNGYKQEIENLNKHIQLLSTNSTNLSVKIDKNTNKITKKLDEVKTTIIKTNNQKLNNFLDNVYRSNQALVSKLQTMYHQNDRASKQAFIILNNSIKSMNEKIEECLSRPTPPDGQPTSEDSNNDQVDIERIIKESNWNFYNAIQGLYEKDSDTYNRKLLEMSIAFTKREHELHIENLKESYHDELLKVKEEANAINSKKLIHISEQVGKSHQKLDNIWKQLNKLQSGFVQTIQENNQKLIDEIGKRFPQTKEELETILNTNKEEIKTVINLPIKHVKKVVKICNSSLYGKIEELFNANKELSKEKILLELAMESTKKENKEAFFELERQHQDKIKGIEKEQIEWERGLDTKYKEKTHDACQELISLTGHKEIRNLEKKSQKYTQEIQELIPYKKKHEEEKKLKSEKKKYNEEFMERIKLRASLKNKLSYTFNYFHRVEEKIQVLTSEFDNDLKKLYDEIKNIEKDIEKFSKEKHFDMIQEIKVKIEGKKTIFFKKIEDDNRTKKKKDKYIKIVVFLVFITILIGVSIEVFLRL